jgi:hypothetical protein
MGEKTPDTDGSGIERRDILKGLGFGAVGLAGVGAMSGGAAAQEFDYIAVVQPGDAPRNAQQQFEDSPEARAELVFGLELNGGLQPVDTDVTIGYQIVILSMDPRGVTTQSFEEGASLCFAGTLNTGAGGQVEVRERFSLSGLGPDAGGESRQYLATVTLTDYSSVSAGQSGDPATVAATQFAVGASGGQADETNGATEAAATTATTTAIATTTSAETTVNEEMTDTETTDNAETTTQE